MHNVIICETCRVSAGWFHSDQSLFYSLKLYLGFLGLEKAESLGARFWLLSSKEELLFLNELLRWNGLLSREELFLKELLLRWNEDLFPYELFLDPPLFLWKGGRSPSTSLISGTSVMGSVLRTNGTCSGFSFFNAARRGPDR